MSIMRVLTSGEVKDYTDTWPVTKMNGDAYIEIIPGDTLVITGSNQSVQSKVIVKALVTSEGLTPIDELTYPITCCALGLLSITQGMYNVYVNWEQGFGLFASTKGDGTFKLASMHLTPEANYECTELGSYSLKDYTWRTYTDMWLPKSTVEKYKDEGFTVFLSDPIDSTTTHVVRLDEKGFPIDPSTLNAGGKRTTLPFAALPNTCKPYVEMLTWGNQFGLYPDSGRVQFWGVDHEGNLYLYKKTKKR